MNAQKEKGAMKIKSKIFNLLIWSRKKIIIHLNVLKKEKKHRKQIPDFSMLLRWSNVA